MVFSFNTRWRSESKPIDLQRIRTMGLVVSCTGALDAASCELCAPQLSRMFEKAVCRPDVACGKVGFVSGGGRPEGLCVQVVSSKSAIVSCVNATGAMLALASARRNGESRIHLTLLPEKEVAVDAHVLWDGRKAIVEQSWRIPEPAVVDVNFPGHRCALVAGALNDYVIVSHAIRPLTKNEVMDLWRDARRYFSDRGEPGFDQPLRRRLLEIAPSDGRPLVRVWTKDCEVHPTMPLTGAAVLSLTAQRIDWLSDLAHRGVRIANSNEEVKLPRICLEPSNWLTIQLQDLVIELFRLDAKRPNSMRTNSTLDTKEAHQWLSF